MSSLIRYWPAAARLALGGVFLVFGLNGFLNFLPAQPIPPAAGAFAGALAASGYMFPLIKASEIVASVLLLANRYVPLALTLLAPILVNILFFHAFLAPSGITFAIALVALTAGLAYAYRAAYAPMLRAKVQPSPIAESAPTSLSSSTAKRAAA